MFDMSLNQDIEVDELISYGIPEGLTQDDHLTNEELAFQRRAEAAERAREKAKLKWGKKLDKRTKSYVRLARRGWCLTGVAVGLLGE